ncbi:MAG: ankyrin repeat domain-containing protein, partial [bacterium]
MLTEVGELPLHLACQENATDIALKLLEVHPKGSKLQDEMGRLPLHYACKMQTVPELETDLLESLLREYPKSTLVYDYGGEYP